MFGMGSKEILFPESSSRIPGRMKEEGMDWREQRFALNFLRGEEGERVGKLFKSERKQGFQKNSTISLVNQIE